MSKIQIYCAVSLDGFIAGPDDDLGWLGEPDPSAVGDEGTVSFEAFMAQTGAMLMGRRTYDVVMSFGGPWPYGETPVLIATHRPLEGAPETVSACNGDIAKLCSLAKEAAGDKNVYLDGGRLITQALEGGIVDELILSVMPVLLGAGVPLYHGKTLQRFDATALGSYANATQLRLTPQPQ